MAPPEAHDGHHQRQTARPRKRIPFHVNSFSDWVSLDRLPARAKGRWAPSRPLPAIFRRLSRYAPSSFSSPADERLRPPMVLHPLYTDRSSASDRHDEVQDAQWHLTRTSEGNDRRTGEGHSPGDSIDPVSCLGWPRVSSSGWGDPHSRFLFRRVFCPLGGASITRGPPPDWSARKHFRDAPPLLARIRTALEQCNDRLSNNGTSGRRQGSLAT